VYWTTACQTACLWIASFYLSPLGFNPLFIVFFAEQTAVASVQRAVAARYLLEGRFPRSVVLNVQAVVGTWNRAVFNRHQKLNLKKRCVGNSSTEGTAISKDVVVTSTRSNGSEDM
jgi:hypothetical protein